MCLYYKCHSSFRDCLRDLVFGARCSYYICRKLLQMNLPCIHNRKSKKTMLKFGQVLRKKKDFDYSFQLIILLHKSRVMHIISTYFES